MTDFSNSAGTGSVNADLATITAIAGNLTGNVTGSVSGMTAFSPTVQTVAAAGATQGAATSITSSFCVITTCTASARGVKLTGQIYVYVGSNCTQGTKVYPGSTYRLGSAATNTAVVLAGFKSNIYTLIPGTKTYVVTKGA